MKTFLACLVILSSNNIFMATEKNDEESVIIDEYHLEEAIEENDKDENEKEGNEKEDYVSDALPEPVLDEGSQSFRVDEWTFTFPSAGVAELKSYTPTTDTLYIPGAYIFEGETEPRRLEMANWNVIKTTNNMNKTKKVVIEEQYGYKFKVKTNEWISTDSFFNGNSTVEYADLTGLDMRHVISIRNHFQHADALEHLDMSGWETTSLQDIMGAFAYLPKMTEIDLSSFDTRQVLNMSWLFYDTPILEKVNLSSFDTRSLITNPGSKYKGKSTSWNPYPTGNMFQFTPRLKVIDVTTVPLSNFIPHKMFEQTKVEQKIVIGTDSKYQSLNYSGDYKVVPLDKLVTFNANGGAFSDASLKKSISFDQVSYNSEAKVLANFNQQLAGILADEPTLDDHIFMGWNLSIEPMDSIADLYEYSSTPIEVTATWEESQTITWDFNQPSIANIDEHLPTGTELTPPSAELTGMHIEGWYTDTALTIPIPTSVPTENPGSHFTYYAKWEENVYDVLFDTNIENITIQKQTVTHGQLVSKPDSIIYEHHSFKGWYDNAAFTGTAWDFAANTVTTDMKLFAKWQEDDKYTLTYDVNTGEGEIPTDENTYYEQQKTVVQSADSISKLHYSFVEWNTQADGKGDSYSENDELIFANKKVTLYAQWKEDDKYRLVYNLNTGDGVLPSDPVLYYEGQETTVKDGLGLSKLFHTFNGWNTQADGKGKQYAENASLTFEKQNVTLFAQWLEDDKFTVSYDANGGEGTAPIDPLDYYSTQKATVLDIDDLSLAHHSFSSWNTQPDGNGIKYLPSSQVTVNDRHIILYAQWKEDDKFSLTYNANLGTGDVPIETTLFYKNQMAVVQSSAGLSRDNHSFVEWNTQADGEGIGYQPGSNLTFIANHVTLYAQWLEDDKQIVIYHANGADGTPPRDTKTYFDGESAKVLDAGELSLKNHSFAGWNSMSDGGGIMYQPEALVSVGATNLNLYAQWLEDDSYTLTYHANGGAGIVPIDLNRYYETDEALIQSKGDLELANHTFVGWNTLQDGTGTWYDADELVTFVKSNITLYAQWLEDEKQIVTYHANGAAGEVPKDNRTYYENEKALILPHGDLEKANHSFVGWNTKADGSGDLYQADDFVLIKNDSIKLYAQWQENTKYTITYHANTALGSLPKDTNMYFENQSATILSPGTLEKKDYRFIGWNTKVDGSGEMLQPQDLLVIKTNNITLFAQWEAKNKYSIIYDGNGAQENIPVDHALYVEGDIVTIQPDIPFKSGHTFMGWSLNGQLYQANDTFVFPDEVVIFVASWKQNKVSYDGNGSDAGSVPEDDYGYLSGDDVVVQLGSATKRGHTFKGWQYNGELYQAGETVVVGDDNIVFVAQWEINTYLIKFEVNGGLPAPTHQMVKFDEKIEFPAQVSRQGYVFMGWYQSSDFSGDAWSFGTQTVDKDMTLYAKWKAKPVDPIKPIAPIEKLPKTGLSIVEKNVFGASLLITSIFILLFIKKQRK